MPAPGGARALVHRRHEHVLWDRLARIVRLVLAVHHDPIVLPTRYSSRTRYTTDVFRRLHNWKVALHHALQRIPEEALTDEERVFKKDLADPPEITILHLIYQQKAYEGHAKDYEFSGTSMREHWQSGYEDTKRTLKHQKWLTIPRMSLCRAMTS
jgi:NTE family protein